MTDAYVSFGANIAGRNPDLASILENVRFILSNFKEIGEIHLSRQYKTPAWPLGSGPDFLNAAMRFETSLEPEALLTHLHSIEARMGRVRAHRWGPRICDLDLLAMGDRIVPGIEEVQRWMDLADTEAIEPPDGLVLPHPRLHRRGFALLPLSDVAPNWRHPVLGQTVAEMIDELSADDIASISEC